MLDHQQSRCFDLISQPFNSCQPGEQGAMCEFKIEKNNLICFRVFEKNMTIKSTILVLQNLKVFVADCRC